jgi:endonuclease/exonuclease/phosphatase family metal-dependent hydrolase
MSHPKLGAAALVAASLLTLSAPAVAPAKPNDVTVMTRNVYVGADLITLATAPDRPTFEQNAAALYQVMLRNDFATRAKALAAEIKKAKPDLVGLQEAARWLRGPDGIKDDEATPANDVVYDSATEILRQLDALGQHYRVVGARDWFDKEASTAAGYDVRVIQRDVILRRVGSKVKTGKTFRGGFKNHFDAPTQAGLAQQLRGWVGVDARLGKRKFRFVTTHLEAYSPEIGEQQAKELLKGPLSSKKRQSILVGDLNSDPKGAQGDRGADRTPNAYGALIDGGFSNGLPRRETCCFAEDLHSTADPLDTWIDHILVRPKVKVVRSSRVGSSTSDMVGGLWPSDHAGIVATLRLKK